MQPGKYQRISLLYGSGLQMVVHVPPVVPIELEMVHACTTSHGQVKTILFNVFCALLAIFAIAKLVMTEIQNMAS